MAGYPSQPEAFTSTSSPLFVTSPVLAEEGTNETEKKQEALKELWAEVFTNFNEFDTAYNDKIQLYLDEVVKKNGQPPNNEIFDIKYLADFRGSYNKLLELESDPRNENIKNPIIKPEYKNILIPDTEKKIKQIENYLKNSEKVLYWLHQAFDTNINKTLTEREQLILIKDVQVLVGNEQNEVTGNYIKTTNDNLKTYLIGTDDGQTSKGQLIELKERIDEINNNFNDDSAFKTPDEKKGWSDAFFQNPTLLILPPVVVLIVGIFLWSFKNSLQPKQTGNYTTPKNKDATPRQLSSIPIINCHGLSDWLSSIPIINRHRTREEELSPTEKAQIFVYVDYILKSRGIQTPNSGNQPTSQVDPEQIEDIVQEYLKDNWSEIITSVVSGVKEVSPEIGQTQKDQVLQSSQDSSTRYPRQTTSPGGRSCESPTHQPPPFVESAQLISQQLQDWIDFYNNQNNQDDEIKVKQAFSKEALELEETPESYNQNRNTITNQIELEVVRRNQGSFWLLAQDNRGWLFPKVGDITQNNRNAVESLFQVEGENQSFSYIEVIKPAFLTTSDGYLWKLTTPGHIVLK